MTPESTRANYWDNRNPDECVNAAGHFTAAVLDETPLCGCGYADQITGALVDALQSIAEGNRWQADPAEWGLFGTELLLHVLDGAELTEHGMSVGGSWITDKGKRFLAAVESLDCDTDRDVLTDSGLKCSLCPPAAPSSSGGSS